MGSWKAVVPGKDKPLELYDLARDIGETNNVADQNRPVVDQMKQIIAAASQTRP